MRKASLFFSLTISSLVTLLVIVVLFTWSQNRVSREEEAVYAALLGGTPGTVILANGTAVGSAFRWVNVHNKMPSVSWRTWSNYLSRNRKSYPVPPDMQLGVKYYLMGEEEMRDIFSRESSGVLNPAEGGWEELEATLPRFGWDDWTLPSRLQPGIHTSSG